MKPAHRLRFFRAGGVDQLRLENGADIAAVSDLDQKLWVALSCPVKGLEFDERTLSLLDSDDDGRVRAPELLNALAFLKSCLKSLDGLPRGSDELPLSSIKDSTDEGKLVLASAKRILAGLGKADATSISVADAMETAKVFAETKFNGDGIITEDCVGDPDAREVVPLVIECAGGEMDRAGRLGVSQAELDEFFEELAAYDAWEKTAEENRDEVLPLGDDTAAAWAAYAAVKAKVDDYFARCSLAEFDERALTAVNRKEEEYLAIAANDLSITAAEVEHFPIARVEAGRDLPLEGGANPAWCGRLDALRTAAVKPLLGKKDALSDKDWRELGDRLAAHGAWVAAKKGERAAALGADRVRAILAGGVKEKLEKLIAKDKAAEPEMKAIESVERLVRYHRDLFRLLNNYVSFSEFYGKGKDAIFIGGSLHMDARRCDMVFKVASPDAHASMAALAKTYLAYCKCTRKQSGETLFIAAAFTNGDADHLMVGRNGVFYDRQGNDWDATVVKVIENPISVRQAFFHPYKRVLRWIEEQVAKRAAAADDAAAGKLTAVASSTGQAAETGKVAAKPKFDVGVVAALGVAVGGITAALGAMLEAFFGLGKWMPLGLIALVLLISGPSMLIAWLKLRQRTLGPILEANGWAMNGRARVNIPLGASLTQLAVLPPGSERSLKDPFAEKRSPWWTVLVLVLILGGAGYGLHRAGYLPQWVDKALVKAGLREPAPPEDDAGAPAEGAPKDGGAPAAGDPAEGTGEAAPPDEGGG